MHWSKSVWVVFLLHVHGYFSRVKPQYFGGVLGVCDIDHLILYFLFTKTKLMNITCVSNLIYTYMYVA